MKGLVAIDATTMRNHNNRLIAMGMLTAMMLMSTAKTAFAAGELTTHQSPVSVYTSFTGIDDSKDNQPQLPSILQTVDYLSAINEQENKGKNDSTDVITEVTLGALNSLSKGTTLPILPQDNIGISTFFSRFHPGIDIRAKVGTSVYSIRDGKVLDTGFEKGGYGKYILVGHNDDDGNPLVSLYAHLKTVNVEIGTTVDTKTVIGEVGLTGRTTGAHLHFEVHKGTSAIDPIRYFAQKQVTKQIALGK